MTETESMKKIVRSTYVARIRGDLEGTMAAFADDVVFEFNGKGVGSPSMATPVHGKAALRPVMKELIESFHFSDWEEISLVAERDKAALHWRANVTVQSNGKSHIFDVFDFITFRDGKIVELRQSTDTAQVRSMIGE
jgi:ketosteroid isomerase-like protein